MEDATRNQFLRDEYLQIQKTIEDLDSKILNIKSWSAAFGSATIGAAFCNAQRLGTDRFDLGRTMFLDLRNKLEDISNRLL